MKRVNLKIWFTLMFGVFALTNAKGQIDSSYFDYKKWIDLAEEYSEKKEYSQALNAYDEAFKLKPYIPVFYFDAFQIAQKNGDMEKAHKYMINRIEHGVTLDENYLYSEDVINYQNTPYWKEYSKNRDQLYQQFRYSIDSSYLDFIDSLMLADQEDRFTIPYEEFSKVSHNDSVRIDVLIFWVKEKGFPTYKTTGIGHNYAHLLLWHQRDNYPNTNQWKTIIPFIKEGIRLGDIDPEFFLMFDEYLSQRKKS